MGLFGIKLLGIKFNIALEPKSNFESTVNIIENCNYFWKNTI
jgi:hypothetical protein